MSKHALRSERGSSRPRPHRRTALWLPHAGPASAGAPERPARRSGESAARPPARRFWGDRWLITLAIIVLLLLTGRLVPVPLEHIVVVIFAAVVIAAAIAPVATFFARWHIPRGVTVIGVYLVALALLAGVVVLLIPLVTSEVSALQQRLPTYVQQLHGFVARYSPNAANRLFGGSLADSTIGHLSGVLNSLPGYLFTATSVVVQVFVVLVLTYFMVAEADFSERLVLRFVRRRHRAHAQQLLSAAGHSLARWSLGAILLALYFGIVFGAGLKIAGIPYAITLGAVGGVLEVIPYVGGAMTMALAALAAGTKGLLWVGVVIGWYAVAAEVEAHIIHPWLVGKIVRLHPIIIAVALFVGGEGFGFLGLLLAVPAAMVLKVVLDDFYPPD